MKGCPSCDGRYSSNILFCPRDGTPLLEVSLWSEGQIIRGKYRILSKVGQGGMAAVYKARHMVFDELRALKVMNPELAGERTLRETFQAGGCSGAQASAP